MCYDVNADNTNTNTNTNYSYVETLARHTGQHAGCGRCSQYWNRVAVLADEYGYSQDEAERLASTPEGVEIVATW